MALSDASVEGLDFQVDGQTAASWQEVTSCFDDASIYQTHAYGAVRWGRDNLSHLVMRHGGRVLAAVQLRIVRVPVLPVGVAYARWGPLCRLRGEGPDPAVVQRMLDHMRQEYCRHRGLVLQIIPNTFADGGAGDPLAEALKNPACRVDSSIPPYRTIHVDLSPDAETIRKRFHQKWRNQLNGSERNGLQLEVSDHASAYEEFIRLYDEMRDRKGFDSAVDVHEFGSIQQELAAGNRMTVFLAKKEGQTVGALVCSLMGDTAIYLLGTTSPLGRNLKASYFLHWQAILWLKSRDARCYDLGGIDPDANPGGYHFKSGFGGQDVIQHPPVTCIDGWLGGAAWRGISWLRKIRDRG